jgi:hypothetical protein
MKLTKNFEAKEFFSRTQPNGPKQIPPPAKYAGNLQTLAVNLQKIRDKVGPLIINSGYRTPKYNASPSVGGAKNSQHLFAKAADISHATLTGPELHKVVLDMINKGEIHNGGLGKYNNFVHYDIRETPARWDKTNTFDQKKKGLGAFAIGVLAFLYFQLVKK